MHELAPSPRSVNGDQSQFEDTPSFERIMGVLQTLTCHAEMTGDPAARMGRPLAHGALDMPSYALLCGKPINAFGLVHTLHVLLATLLCVRVCACARAHACIEYITGIAALPFHSVVVGGLTCPLIINTGNWHVALWQHTRSIWEL